jgi:transcriptional regulator with XRE-family HTH domain
VPEPTRPPFLRRKLGAKLRRMREQAGKNLEDAAALLDKTRSALGRIESGETKADVHLLRSMMDIYDQYDPGLIDEAREALKPPWFRAYGVKDLGYIDVETEATHVDQFSIQVVPGLLQTQAYIRALFERRRHWNPAQLDSDLAVRLVRQKRLTDEDRPLKLAAVVDEAALRRQIGRPGVMREQLQHLAATAALPTVTLQVLTMDYGAHCAMPGAFNLLAFPDPDDMELLFIEHLIGSLHIEDQDKVREARLAFDQLRTEALSPADSVALIERLAAESGH